MDGLDDDVAQADEAEQELMVVTFAVPAATIGLVVLVAGWLTIGGLAGLLGGLLLGPAVGAGSLARALGRAEPRALAEIGGTEADRADPSTARLLNLVDGVALLVGAERPRVVVVRDDRAVAGVVGTGPAGVLVVSDGLVDALERVQLEAVVARELLRLRTGVHRPLTLAAGSWVTRLVPQLADRILAPLVTDRRVLTDDGRAAIVVRYPPALAGAFEEADRLGVTTPGGPRLARCAGISDDPIPLAIRAEALHAR